MMEIVHLIRLNAFAIFWLIAGLAICGSQGGQSKKHSIEFNIEGQATVLEFQESDDFSSLSLEFILGHGLHLLDHDAQCEGGVSGASCLNQLVTAMMRDKAASHVADEVARGVRAFDVSPSPKLDLVVVDQFLSDPEAMRSFGLSREFKYKGNHPGMRSASFANMLAFRPIRRKVEELVGAKLPFWFASFQRTFANDTDSGVHRDYPTYKYSALLYLNPEADPKLGTSTWRHKETGLYDYPTESEARQFTADSLVGADNGVQFTPEGLADRLAEDPGEEAFVEVDRIGNRFNRLFVFNSRLNHRSSVLGGRGAPGSLDDARLVLILFFNTEDKIGQSGSVLWEDQDAYAVR